LLLPPDIYIGGFHTNQRDGNGEIYSSLGENGLGNHEKYTISDMTYEFYMITDMIPKVFEGNFEFDKKNGYGISWNIYNWDEDSENRFFPDQKWREGNFLNDQPHGRGFKQYHKHGAGLEGIATYDNGRQVGAKK
jgi:hypothetical protein